LKAFRVDTFWEVTKFGNAKFFFSRSGISACGLENCREEDFGHLPGEEEVVEGSSQSSRDVLLKGGKTRAGEQKGTFTARWAALPKI